MGSVWHYSLLLRTLLCLAFSSCSFLLSSLLSLGSFSLSQQIICAVSFACSSVSQNSDLRHRRLRLIQFSQQPYREITSNTPISWMGKLRHREVKSMDEVPSSLTQMINLDFDPRHCWLNRLKNHWLKLFISCYECLPSEDVPMSGRKNSGFKIKRLILM